MALNPRIFFGLDTSAKMAWRASKPGVNVLTNTDPEDFTFDSDWPRTGLIHEVGEVAEGGLILFEELPFKPFVDVYGVKDGKLIADHQVIFDWSVSISGPINAWWPVAIQEDRFILNVADEAESYPDSLVYIVWRVPIAGA